MDKNSLIGFLLIAVVLIGFTFYSQQNQPNAPLEEKGRTEAKTDIKQEDTTIQDVVADTQRDSSDVFYTSTQGTDRNYVLRNKDVSISIAAKGGSVSEVSLLGYKDQSRTAPVRLFAPKDASFALTFTGRKEPISTKDYYFKATEVTDSTLTLALEGKDGARISLNYALKNRFFLSLSVSAEGMYPHLDPSAKKLGIEWKENAKQQEKGYKFENQYATLTYKEKDGSTDYLNAAKDDDTKCDASLDWVAFKNQFFSCVLIADESFDKATLSSHTRDRSTGYLKRYEAEMETKFDPSGKEPTHMQFYFGPTQYRLLKKMNRLAESDKDLELERLVYLGWPLFRLINKYFTIYVFDWLTNLGFSMGIVLLLITILLRIIVYLPTKKSVMSSIKMKVLKPKVDEIAKKYPNPEDNLKKQQEVMATYSKYGVSPMGGCLPLLVQMPIWIAMFNFIPNAIELRQQSFLWADDLSTYDTLVQFSKDYWLIGDHLSLFCILFCLTNIVYSWLNMRMQKDNMMGQQASQLKMMQWMMYGMPVFFFFIFNDYSSGLNYYYFISLLASALTMWYIRKRVDEKKVLAQLEANYKANKENPKKMSGFAARLEELQRQQEEKMNSSRKK